MTGSRHADTLFQQAILYLTGQRMPRDLARARALFRAAADAGHAEADLFEIALAANGSGGPRDWRGAFGRLERAAARHPEAAAADLDLVKAMALDEDGLPLFVPKPEQLHASPNILLFRALVTPAECAAIAASVSDIMQPSTVADPASGRRIAHPIRTSEGAVIGPTRESLPIAAINRRLAAASQTQLSHGEPLSVLRYSPGQQYRLHHDALTGAANQRAKTVLVYLNQGYGGGETDFPDLGIRVAGRIGDVLVFDNLDAAGRPEPLSRHAGLPVTRGAKWLATRWIRVQPVDPWKMS